MGIYCLLYSTSSVWVAHVCSCLNKSQLTWETPQHSLPLLVYRLTICRLSHKHYCFCESTLSHKLLDVIPFSFPLSPCILYLGFLYIFSSRGSFIWFFTPAKFLLNPQAFSAGADPRSRWTVWMVSHLWGLWPLPPSAPCVVPNYSWIPFNKRQAGRQASRHHLPKTPSLLFLSSSQEEKI